MELKSTDWVASIEADLDSVKSTQDFCKGWKEKWRGIAVAAQGILSVFFPAGAKVLGILIAIADNFCANP